MMTKLANYPVSFICLGIIHMVVASGDECITTVAGYTWNYDSITDQVILESPSVDACFQECSQDDDCQGYTFATAVINICYKFKHKLKGIHTCVACTSGNMPEKIQGGCVEGDADILDHGSAESFKECFDLCSETNECKSYTWWDKNSLFPNTCFLFKDCQSQLTCDGCASGRINCISFLPDQCSDYKILNESDRSTINGGCGENGGDECYCDREDSDYSTSLGWQGPAYYRFEEPAGTQIPETTPGVWHCGTGSSGWLSGKHPVEDEVETTMTVCFDAYADGECNFSTEITVTKCPDFFVYKLSETSDCNQRYCGVSSNIPMK